MAGTLSPAAVSPCVLAGDGSYSEACLALDAEASFSKEGTAVLGNRLAASSAGLFGVAGNCDILGFFYNEIFRKMRRLKIRSRYCK